MPRKVPGLIQPTMPTYREILLDHLYKSVNCVKSFDLATCKLTTHYWYAALIFHKCHCSSLLRPVHEGRRITPDQLTHHRETHQFFGPGCLCPLLAPVTKEVTFIEAAIYMPVFGSYKGEYVARCAKNRCGYVGETRLSSEAEQVIDIQCLSALGKDI
jgi:hypothetical protein